MSPKAFPFNQYSAAHSGDSNAQHLLYLLEGYRAAVTEADRGGCPYSPGSARGDSWEEGARQARLDLGRQIVNSWEGPAIINHPIARTVRLRLEISVRRTCRGIRQELPDNGSPIEFTFNLLPSPRSTEPDILGAEFLAKMNDELARWHGHKVQPPAVYGALLASVAGQWLWEQERARRISWTEGEPFA